MSKRLLAVIILGLAVFAAVLGWLIFHRPPAPAIVPEAVAPHRMKVGPPPPWTGLLAASRATDWTQAGIVGGIPSASWPKCGSTIAPYTGSATTIINALIACSGGSGGYVLLGNGTFNLSTSIHNVGLSNVELRGGGPQNTHIHLTGVSTCGNGAGTCFADFQSSDTTYAGSATYMNWTNGFTQGGTTVTLTSGTANVTSLAVGKMIILDQLDDATDTGNYFNCQAAYNTSTHAGCSENGSDNAARANRGQQEMSQIVSCSPSCGSSGTITVTLSHPLIHPNWRSGQTPQAWLISPTSYVGFQGFSMDATGYNQPGGASPTLTFPLAFTSASQFWVKNVIISNAPSSSIFINQATDGDLESNYIYGIGQLNNGNDSSGFETLMFNTLIANNICHGGKICYLPFGPGAGNVIAYNFAINAFTGDQYMFGNMWMNHSSGADYNLYEGNVVDNLLWDQTHGTANMNTGFRNFLPGWESCSNGNCGSPAVKQNNMDAFEIGGFDGRYANLLANVSGTAGISTLGYTRLQQAGGGWFSGAGNGYIYNLAFGNNAITNVIPADPITTATTYRYGNWDAFNGSTQCNASEVPSGIAVYPNPVPSTCPSSSSWPASFYFPARPSWYSTGIPFPAMGGDVTGGNVGACGGTLNTSGQFASVGATNASQCAGKGLGAAWGGHINAIPAMAYYLGLGGLPDGTGPILPFDGSTYYASTPTAVVPVFTPPGASSGSSAQPYGTVINLATASSGCGPYIFWGSTNPPTNNGTTFTILGAVTIYGQVQGCPGYLNSPVGSIAYTLTAPPAPTNVSVIQNQ